MSPPVSRVAARQRPLRRHFRDAPDDAWITEAAHTAGGAGMDPFHGEVVAEGAIPARITFGNHRAVGGDHDRPNPGNLLCAALAACLDITVRTAADGLGIVVLELGVRVTAGVDVRGTLGVDRAVPVGFQTLWCNVDLTVAEGTDRRLLERLVAATEHRCVNLQTLRAGADVRTSYDLATADHQCADAPRPQA